MKTWLQDNEIEIYLTCKETKSVVAERFIRNLKYKISKKKKKKKKMLTLISWTIKISKYKNTFAKGCTRNWLEEVFIIKRVKNLFTMNICKRRS